MLDNIIILLKNNREITNKYKIRGLFVIFFSVFIAILELASISLIIPIVSYYSTNDLSGMNNNSFGSVIGFVLKLFNYNIFKLTLVFVLIVIITALGRIYLTLLMRMITNKFGNDLAIKLFNKATGDDYSYHLKIDKTKIISSFNKIDYLMDGVLSPLFLSISALVICMLMVIFLLFINVKLAIYSMGSLALIYIIISKSVNNKLIKNSYQISELQTKNLSIVSSSINNIKSIIINQSGEIFQNEFKLIDFKRRMAMAKNNVIGIVPKYLVESLGLVAMLLILLSQSINGEKNSTAIPFIAGLLFAFQKMLPMIQTVYQSWTQIKGSDMVLQDVINVLDVNVSEFSKNEIYYNSSLDFKTIKLEGINFSYKDNSKNILENINIEINAGEKIAIIGKSGAGKTTLIEVLLSLLKYTNGNILCDGKKINNSNIYQYRSLFSYVSQDVYLIEDTIEKNIAFTLDEKKINKEKLKDSIKRANLDLFVNELPLKEKTFIGTLRMLSGGQKQRIGLARAFYHNSKIMIFDESTSNLDPKTEFEIVESLTQNNDNLTIIMITHKYDNLNLFDRVFKMENGTFI